jgi:hypothetical protein
MKIGHAFEVSIVEVESCIITSVPTIDAPYSKKNDKQHFVRLEVPAILVVVYREIDSFVLSGR